MIFDHFMALAESFFFAYNSIIGIIKQLSPAVRVRWQQFERKGCRASVIRHLGKKIMSECSILWCGKYRQNWETTPHTHTFFQLILITNGEGQIPLEDAVLEVKPGHAVLIRPGESHAVLCSPDASMQLLDVKFSVNDPTFFEAVNRLENHLVPQDFPWCVHCFESIIRESQNHEQYYYPLICNNLYELLVRLLRGQAGEPAVASHDLPPLGGQPFISKYHGVDVEALMQYIYFNYASIITLDDLAEAANINKTTLISLFKELYGTTPIRYINRLRMQKAKELLSNTDTSISEIAELIGFQSIHYFSRYFKSKENCTPLEFRMRTAQGRYFNFQ